jgi:hypothetical protein
LQLEPLLAKGVELPGPETVTETAAEKLHIEDGALHFCLIVFAKTGYPEHGRRVIIRYALWV